MFVVEYWKLGILLEKYFRYFNPQYKAWLVSVISLYLLTHENKDWQMQTHKF